MTKRVHQIRQSTIKTLDMCSERARSELAGEMPEQETDAACAGTAVHAGIEASLDSVLHSGEPLSLATTNEVAQWEFSGLMTAPSFTWVKYDEAKCRDGIYNCIATWYNDVLPGLKPKAVEQHFSGLTIHEDDKRVINLSGTVDLVDESGVTIDWKTASREYKRWEKQRWDIQATQYTWAMKELGLISPVGPWDFEFVVMTLDGGLQRVPITRHEGDHEWLKKRCIAMAELIEADLSIWPLNDNGWWCSSKWCGKWDQCKGATRNETDNY